VNASSSGLYYAYTTNGIQYEVTSLFESSKYKAQSAQNPSISSYPEVNAKGSSLTLNPLFNPSGLVGYWPMDEGSGNIAYDESGIGNKATFGCLGTSCSNPSWAGGRIGSFALSESPGASQSSYAKASPVNNPASSGSVLSISLWIDPNSSQSDGGVFIRNGNGGDENYGFELNSQSGGLYSVRLEAYSGSFVSATSNHIVPTSVWSNLVLIFTQGQNFQIYLNGVFQQTVSFPYVSVLSTSDLGLGGTDGTYQSLDGLIDDVRIYSRALSAAEISALYNAEK